MPLPSEVLGCSRGRIGFVGNPADVRTESETAAPIESSRCVATQAQSVPDSTASSTSSSLPEIYYETGSALGHYWIKDAQGCWIKINESSAKRHLKQAGFMSKSRAGEIISPLELCLNRIQQEQNVDYAGPLAGHRQGLYGMNGKRVLVTSSPKLITPREGDWGLLGGIFEQMLGRDPAGDQRPYFFGWLHVWLESLYGYKWAPGQTLVLAGGVNTCKSLTQRLITEISGGRSAKCFQYMAGRTDFNADHFHAEHLMVEDDAESTDIRTRRHFGASIKGVAVNQDHCCHPKGKTALTLKPRWRLTVSVNDEPERLLVLPPIDADIEDKIILLRASRVDLPMPAETPQEKERFWAALMSELPAFVHFIRNFQIPPEMHSTRFGVLHYHHPELLDTLNQLSPEAELLALVDHQFQRERIPAVPWRGTARGLENILRDCDATKRSAERLFTWHNACGSYLSRLARSQPTRVRVVARSHWEISPPPSPGVEVQSCSSLQ